MSLAWERPADTTRFSRYLVRDRRTGTSSWSTVASLSDRDALSFDVSGLENGVSYDFRVEQRYRGNKVGVSNEVSATPIATRVPIRSPRERS